MTSAPVVFDRSLRRQRREKAAARFSDHSFIHRMAADSVLDRLSLIKKDFSRVLLIGGDGGYLSAALRQRAGTAEVVTIDLSAAMLGGEGIAADDETLPFAPASFDAVISFMTLHWVNDVPGVLAQIARVLRPDGLVMIAAVGGETLTELRQSLMQAELDVTGGVSPRVSPMMSLRDMGALMQRAGFALPVVDNDVTVVDYSHPLRLLADVRGMGAGNVLSGRVRHFTARRLFARMADIYQRDFSDAEGRIRATVDMIYAIGWTPHASQQKPLARGTGLVNLKDILS